MIAVVGPTASGKSALGIRLALHYGGEIVNCDSVQVYREIEIATGKVPLNARCGIQHHLLDFLSPKLNYTAGDWAGDASRIIPEIEGRGHLALIVGGTGLYLHALRQPLFETPPTDEQVRLRLTNLRMRKGAEYLHKLLQRLDAQSASGLHPRDWARVQRALEVRFQTGNSISDVQPHWGISPEFVTRMIIFALYPPREKLYERINALAELWFESGLQQEVQSLINSGTKKDAKVFKALGYRHMLEYMQGKLSRDEGVNRMKIDTRRLAKRQLTWWRSWPDVRWIYRFGDDPEAFQTVVEYVERFKLKKM